MRERRGRGPGSAPARAPTRQPGAPAAAPGARCRRLGIRTSALGRQPRRRDRVQQDLGAEAVAADERARAADLAAERRHHVGEPVERVRVARAVLGVAVQRQVGQDHAEAVVEVLDDRLELAVAQAQRVQQHERRPGSRLAVGDARAVAVRARAAASSAAGSRAAHRARSARAPRGSAASPSVTGSHAPHELGVDRRWSRARRGDRADEVAQLRRGRRRARARAAASRSATGAARRRPAGAGVAARALDALATAACRRAARRRTAPAAARAASRAGPPAAARGRAAGLARRRRRARQRHEDDAAAAAQP